MMATQHNQSTRIQGKKAPLTTVHIVQHLAPGGLETMVIELLKQTPAHERCYIISLEGTQQQAIQNWPILRHFQSQLVFLNKAEGLQLSLIKQLSSELKRLNADVVHTHHIGPLLYGGIAARMARITTCIHTEHDMWHLQNTKRRHVETLALKLVNPILVADADEVSKQLNELFPFTESKVIKNGIDCNRFVPANQAAARRILGLPADNLLIGTAGRLVPVKSHTTLIKAVSRLPENTHLAIAGAGPLEQELKQLCVDLNIAHRVHFLGLVSDMPSFYQSLDVFCLPSSCEGFPLSPLEAQACNIPVVVTDVGAARETLCPLSGLTTKSKRVFSLLATLEKAIATRHLFTPRDFVVEHNDVRTMSQAYRALAVKA